MSETVFEIISTQLGIAASSITLETKFRALPNVDSIRVLEIIVAVEKRFDVELPDDVTFRIETVGEFVELVSALAPAQP
jgi:acyl carrier protein